MFVEDLAIYNCSHTNNQNKSNYFELNISEDAFLQFFKLKTLVKCPFAKTATIVDHMHWDQALSFNSNLEILLYKMKNFTRKCKQYRLDGFVVTAPSSFSTCPKMLGEFLRRILFYLSEHDPASSCFDEDIRDRHWRYSFSSMHFFISAFSPCYSVASSRTTNGIDQTIVLLQPKTSFTHGLSPDHAIKFSQHEYVRDKFCRAGAPYPLRDLEWQRFVFPYSYADKAIEWWKPDNSFDFEGVHDKANVGKSMACVMM